MGRFTVTHELNGNEEAVWRLFLDKDIQTRLHKERLGYSEYSIVEQNESGTETTRKAHAVPRMDLPGPVIKLLGTGYRYTEEGHLNKSTKIWSAKLIPSTMADKLRQQYTMRLESAGPNKVRRIVDYEFEAKVFGVGGLMESSFEKQLRIEWDESAAFLNQQLGGR